MVKGLLVIDVRARVTPITVVRFTILHSQELFLFFNANFVVCRARRPHTREER